MINQTAHCSQIWKRFLFPCFSSDQGSHIMILLLVQRSKRVITELSNSLFLLLCLKDVITRLSKLWIFYTSVSEKISKSSKKIFNLLHPRAVIIAIKYEFSSCSVSKLWSEGSLCEFVSSLFQSNDQGAQISFSIHYISKQWSNWSSLIFLLTLSQSSDQKAQ